MGDYDYIVIAITVKNTSVCGEEGFIYISETLCNKLYATVEDKRGTVTDYGHCPETLDFSLEGSKTSVSTTFVYLVYG